MNTIRKILVPRSAGKFLVARRTNCFRRKESNPGTYLL